ncbi:hypothetical protein SOV_22540 [Sporomusa ovata DSM 2662]|uniref:Uncharacterized protein n=1 Tax=Sporomusa ovata TaxID=2378 RepID=A0A0U1L349_9FIRM|nr:hypothetical protein [Sporomusa ovata]EQB25570.1 hypothetical protein SOV_4c02330 [Sporomusa ovata DSM 2662]CQR74127.1 hypothetical protein SpAn4DRAFT_0589 [Sporomusa ovata]
MPSKPKKKHPVQFLGYVAVDGVVSTEPPEWFIQRLGIAFDSVLDTESTRKEQTDNKAG